MAQLRVNISLGSDLRPDTPDNVPPAPASSPLSHPSRSKLKDKNKKNIKKTPALKMWQIRQMEWARQIKKLREHIRNVKPLVDDQAPQLQVPSMLDPGKLSAEENRVRTIDLKTKNLIKAINFIDRNGGKTETFGMKGVKLDRKTNLSDRKNALMTIEKDNLRLAQVLKEAKPRVVTAAEHGMEWKQMESYLAELTQYPLFWKIKKKRGERIEVAPPVPYFTQYVTEKSAKYPDKRPRVFFEVSIQTMGVVGRIVAVLFSDYVPKTVKNFLTFCDPNGKLTYKGNRFYLIFQNFFCQTGDVVENMGFGGTSIYGPYFGDEDHTLQHGERGVLTMFNKIPNRNHSQFLITFRRLNSMDGHNVVFGKIIKGFNVLEAIESVGSKKTGRPKVEIYISDCDEI